MVPRPARDRSSTLLPNMDSILYRYHDIVDDAASFTEACRSPLPDTCWTPRSRLVLLDTLPPSGIEALSWTDLGFRLRHRDPAFGAHFLTGGFLIQEEAAMMAVQALDPRPGERVLDLCAAPGNKTVQLAEAVGPEGWVVANDVSESRLTVLRGLADRFGLTNLTITVHDGASFPERELANGSPLLFDAVLADVPCSCEGTCRKHPDVLHPRSSIRKEGLPSLQEALLRKAIRLTKPGGRVLYATCTFAPEENEGVVQRVISAPDAGQEVQLETIRLDGVTTAPGLTSWKDERWPAELSSSVRIWPHHNDTGGFYLALLRKPETTVPSGVVWPTAALRPLDTDQVPWAAYDMEDDWLDQHATIASGRKHTRVVTRNVPEVPLNIISVGMSGLNLKAREARLSSSLSIVAAPHARAGLARIQPDEIIPFLKRESLKEVELTAPAARTRYVLVMAGQLALGLGHVAPDGTLESLFPVHSAGLPVTEWLDSLSAAQ